MKSHSTMNYSISCYLILSLCQLTSAFLPSPLAKHHSSRTSEWPNGFVQHGDGSLSSLQLCRSRVQIILQAEAVNKASGESSGDQVKLIIAGAPASGKGTQCEVIKEKYGVVHLSTGDMLRAAVAAGSDVGKKAKDYMDSGRLVPDDVIIGVVSFIQPAGALSVLKTFDAFCFKLIVLVLGERPLDGD